MDNDNLFLMGDPNKLYEAIGKASANFDDIPKKQPGRIGNQPFLYASYHVIRKCILKHLSDQGVTMMQPMHTVGDKAAVSLIVSGHGASITSRMVFPLNENVQIFGKESTYFRRYQLQAFFCLEGDKDADDPDDAVETPAKVVKTNGTVSKPANKPAVQTDNSVGESGKNNVIKSDIVAAATKIEATQVESKSESQPVRSPNDNLMNAKAQLGWSFDQFGEYCKKNAEHFPDFVDITKMKNPEKVKLHQMLVKEFSLAPF
jgi:hypothetical protein